jgi:DNA-binding NarL/FixJ family response regulator
MEIPKRTIRVLIADDHPVTRQGIRAILEEAPDIEVVGEAKDGVEAKQMVAELDPDILLLDLVMPGLPVYEIEAWVRANCPTTVTLILTGHDRDYYLTKALEAGVAGFLIKEEAPQRLVEAVCCAAQGEVLISGKQFSRARSWHTEALKPWESLTERERQVLGLVVKGLANKQIAQVLTISERTVENHIHNLLSKLGVTSRAQAIGWIWQHNLVEELDTLGQFPCIESKGDQPD